MGGLHTPFLRTVQSSPIEPKRSGSGYKPVNQHENLQGVTLTLQLLHKGKPKGLPYLSLEICQ